MDRTWVKILIRVGIIVASNLIKRLSPKLIKLMQEGVTYLEKVAKETKNPYDDMVVDTIKDILY